MRAAPAGRLLAGAGGRARRAFSGVRRCCQPRPYLRASARRLGYAARVGRCSHMQDVTALIRACGPPRRAVQARTQPPEMVGSTDADAYNQLGTPASGLPAEGRHLGLRAAAPPFVPTAAHEAVLRAAAPPFEAGCMDLCGTAGASPSSTLPPSTPSWTAPPKPPPCPIVDILLKELGVGMSHGEVPDAHGGAQHEGRRDSAAPPSGSATAAGAGTAAEPCGPHALRGAALCHQAVPPA